MDFCMYVAFTIPIVFRQLDYQTSGRGKKGLLRKKLRGARNYEVSFVHECVN
jgi:hypothetical protein